MYYSAFTNLKKATATMIQDGCNSTDTSVCPTPKVLPKVAHNAEGTGFCDRLAEIFNTVGTVSCTLTTHDNGTFDDTTKNLTTTNGMRFYNLGSDPVSTSLCAQMANGLCASTKNVPYDSINTCDGSSDISYDAYGSENTYCADNKWAGAKKACDALGMRLPTNEELVQMYLAQTGTNGTTQTNLNMTEAYNFFSLDPYDIDPSGADYELQLKTIVYVSQIDPNTPNEIAKGTWPSGGIAKSGGDTTRCVKGTSVPTTVKLSDTLYVDNHNVNFSNDGYYVDEGGYTRPNNWAGAAKACSDKGMRLPTKAEASIMYTNKDSLWLSTDDLWTSEADGTYKAWALDLHNNLGSFYNYLKYSSNSARCVMSNAPAEPVISETAADNPSADYYDVFIDITGTRGENKQYGSRADIMEFWIFRNGLVFPVPQVGASIDRNYLSASVRYTNASKEYVMLLDGVTYKEAVCKAGHVSGTGPLSTYCNCPHEGVCLSAYTQDTEHCPLVNNTCEVVINKPWN